LTGEQIPDSGIIEAGETIKLGVYDQMGIKMEKPDQTVLDFVLEQVQTNDQFSATDASVDARRLLTRFEFPRQRWNQRICVLSGGERRRLQLLTVITKNPNFLILDECTSDLDHQTVMAVESYLQDFKGVLLIISHDRFFADKVCDSNYECGILVFHSYNAHSLPFLFYVRCPIICSFLKEAAQ
jgi:ABC transport system ATP-binding/permease protein